MHLWEEFAPELVTDLYELTMAASYLREGMNGEATFSLFIRDIRLTGPISFPPESNILSTWSRG